MKLNLILFFCILAATQARFVKRIQGGQDADPTIFKNIVSLHGRQKNGAKLEFIGSGIIYTLKWILVSGSSSSKIDVTYPRDLLEVYAGTPDLKKHGRYHQKRSVIEVLTHHKFNPDTLYKNVDLGLLQVHPSLESNHYVEPYLFSSSSIYPKGSAIVAGWGATNLVQLGLGMTSNTLKEAKVEIMDEEMCIFAIYIKSQKRNLEYSKDHLDRVRFCTGQFDSRSGPSVGDYGSPIMQKNQSGKYEVLGLTYSAPLPTEGHGPVFYMNIANFIGWMQVATGEEQ